MPPRSERNEVQLSDEDAETTAWTSSDEYLEDASSSDEDEIVYIVKKTVGKRKRGSKSSHVRSRKEDQRSSKSTHRERHQLSPDSSLSNKRQPARQYDDWESTHKTHSRPHKKARASDVEAAAASAEPWRAAPPGPHRGKLAATLATPYRLYHGRASNNNACQQSGVYAIKTTTKDGSHLFYVGKSENIERRIKDHKSGLGVGYMVGGDTRRVALLTDGSHEDLESWERNETLQRMYKFGISNVRGWMFTAKDLSKDDVKTAFCQICEKFDLCRRCGRNSHFQNECFAKSTAPWASGIALA